MMMMDEVKDVEDDESHPNSHILISSTDPPGPGSTPIGFVSLILAL